MWDNAYISTIFFFVYVRVPMCMRECYDYFTNNAVIWSPKLYSTFNRNTKIFVWDTSIYHFTVSIYMYTAELVTRLSLFGSIFYISWCYIETIRIHYTMMWEIDTCDEWGIKRFQTRLRRVWNSFIPHESQVSIYHNQDVVDSLSRSPINTNKSVF